MLPGVSLTAWMLVCQVAVAGGGDGAVPFAGVEWVPLSRADLSWVDDGRTSGLGVGEFDGFVRPALTAYGGAWLGRRLGLSGGLGVARLQSTTWVGETYQQRHWGVVRPSIDLRVGLADRVVQRPVPWLVVGMYGDIPSSRDVSNGYSEEEQEVADQSAYEDRLRLGGLGGRLGLGIDYRVVEGVALGASYAVELHRSVLRTSDVGTVTSWLTARAALHVTFEWPGRE